MFSATCDILHPIYKRVLYLYLFSKHSDSECYHYLTVLHTDALAVLSVKLCKM